MENNNTGNSTCSFREGELMCCAPLAMAYTPMQQSSQPAYEADQALVRGTLFPGLDLPFMNIVNKGSFSDTTQLAPTSMRWGEWLSNMK